MRSTWLMRSRWIAAVAALVGATAVTPAAAKPNPNANKPSRPRAQNLFASSGYLFQVNRQQCGLDIFGEVCVAFSGSPVGGGGFWPKGTPDQYIFNSGLQIAAVIPDTAGGGKSVFSWAGDTAGAFFFDARGDQGAGEGLSLAYSRLDPNDVAAWPNGAKVRNPADPTQALYNPALVGQDAISQGDVWMRYWEGNPVFATGRTHPMGIAVDERVLAWNYPSGNEDIIYILYTFYNVTAASTSGKYTNNTIPAAIQPEIAAIGDLFQALNKQKYKFTLPAGGYTLTSMFAAEGMDADVALFSTNYATAFIPFNLGTIYAGNFFPIAGWVFPPDIFGAPFFAGPGFIGVKFLKSPAGLAMFSMTVNSATVFPDPFGVNELYRYLSGHLENSGRVCNPYTSADTARARHICFLNQDQSDSRFFQSSGPFTLPPGEARSIVVAYINAAPVANPGVQACPDCENPPGVPAQPDELFADSATFVRTIDRVAGWISATDKNGDSKIQQDEVTSVPRSLLDKALKAQAVFDNGFLLEFAPDAPDFFLLPGDNQVTVVWQKSRSETTGDTYYQIASKRFNVDPVTGDVTANPLFDPNFRQFDVEGYRVYRGRTSSALSLVAQFDYAGTAFVDFTGEINYGNCAPELGVQTDCPVTFDPSFSTSNAVPLVGDIVQVPPGGRVKLESGDILVLKPDSAVENVQCADVKCPKLSDTGVPFALVDRAVRNSFTYFYTVTAFDVNSVASGVSSLESPRVTKRVTPRKPSGQEAGANITNVQLLGAAGQTLDPSAPVPDIDSATGIFSGPMPPTNGFQSSLAVFVPQIVTGGTVNVSIDSVLPGSGAGSPGTAVAEPAIYYITGGASGQTPTHITVPLQFDCCSANTAPAERFLPVVQLDSAKSATFGGSKSYALYASVALSGPGAWRVTSWGRGEANGNPDNSSENGPRWWNGTANENTPGPNSSVCIPSFGGCTLGVIPTASVNAGRLINPGDDTVRLFHELAYATETSSPGRDLEGITAGVTRAADFKVYWGAAGAIDSVIDATHHVPVPFSTKIRASWGILNDSSFVNVVSGVWQATHAYAVADNSLGYALSDKIVDANGNIQKVTTGGTSGSTEPTWAALAGATTVDGTVIWTNLGPNATKKASTADTSVTLLTWSDAACVDPAPTLLSPPLGTTTRCGGTAQNPAIFQNHARLSPIAMQSTSYAGTAALSVDALGTKAGQTGNGFIFYLNGHFFLMQMAALPPSGTVWNARYYAGSVTHTAGANDYAFVSRTRPPAVPGLRAQFQFTGSTFNPTATNAAVLANVHTVPDPYYVSNALEISASLKVLKFVNVPARCIIRIYSVSGILVTVLPVDDPTGGGEVTWNLRNRNNQFVASGVYFYHIETPDGKSKVGRFTIVNFAP